MLRFRPRQRQQVSQINISSLQARVFLPKEKVQKKQTVGLYISGLNENEIDGVASMQTMLRDYAFLVDKEFTPPGSCKILY